jgi:hypothetical protein
MGLDLRFSSALGSRNDEKWQWKNDQKYLSIEFIQERMFVCVFDERYTEQNILCLQPKTWPSWKRWKETVHAMALMRELCRWFALRHCLGNSKLLVQALGYAWFPDVKRVRRQVQEARWRQFVSFDRNGMWQWVVEALLRNCLQALARQAEDARLPVDLIPKPYLKATPKPEL